MSIFFKNRKFKTWNPLIFLLIKKFNKHGDITPTCFPPQFILNKFDFLISFIQTTIHLYSKQRRVFTRVQVLYSYPKSYSLDKFYSSNNLYSYSFEENYSSNNLYSYSFDENYLSHYLDSSETQSSQSQPASEDSQSSQASRTMQQTNLTESAQINMMFIIPSAL
ncbi:hypothetical protein BpHYR1_020977 [Brachionus plicatilis]|uniref:Uncharacterized protein n=1 Tax=Brachionus plicatilis TaxID=10195 RepID=A0A3M7P4N8_BRAPC|nr:hypothetical protein BpHYR1_020977 [Brachionus plicatilis]